jgi:hypothetical protein
MTPEEIAARTRLEQEAGRTVGDTEAKPKDSRGMEGRDTSPFIEFVEPSTAQEWAQLPIDPEVKLPADVQASIARGKAAYRKFKKSWRKRMRPKGPGDGPFFITSVVNKEVQDRRDAAISALEKQSAEKGGQPPMVVRLRVVCILVDRHLADGVRFATARASQMNKLVREWLNRRAARSRDRSKSRSKQVSPDAVEYVLKQIKGLVD